MHGTNEKTLILEPEILFLDPVVKFYWKMHRDITYIHIYNMKCRLAKTEFSGEKNTYISMHAHTHMLT